ncbi:MAG: hypothetical protein QOG21_277 [Actinomycetota bacterium]|nr:hypothetical protein [Actinomycetota bacterium]
MKSSSPPRRNLCAVMDPSSPQVAAVEAVIVASVALCFGRLVIDAIAGHRLDGLTKWALALPGLVLFVFVLMLMHIATGGAIFSNPWITRVLTVLTAAALFIWRRMRREAPQREGLQRWQMWTVFGTCVLGAVVWGFPVARVLPLNFGPDTNLHMGWATQLMIGESTPSTVITGNVPGSYPWIYHALVAFLARFTPGGRAFDALGPLQLVQVVGAILGLLGIGTHMTGKFITGVAAAFFGALCGGFGIGLLFDGGLRDSVVDLPATKVPWLGDILSRRPYNFAFNNIAPAYPRDVSFSLLVGFLLLLLIGLRGRSYLLLAMAGIVLGFVGLSGGEGVIVGSAVAVVVCLAQPEVRPVRAAVSVFLPMGLVWGTWLVPLIVNYFRFGGFVNTTHVGPVVLTWPFLLLSWGLATPFAVVGLAASVRSLRTPSILVPLVIVVVTAVIMASNVIPDALGSSFLTFGRDHRYWSLCQLGVALFAALGATVVVERLRTYRAAMAAITIAVVALGIASPALGGALYPQKDPPNKLIEASLEGRRTLLNALAPAPHRRCVVAVAGNLLAREVFAYTGYRLVLWVIVPGRTNWARIRWRDIYQQIPGDLERAADNRTLTRGTGPPARWRAVAHKYGVNFVVVPRAHAGSPVFAGYPKRNFSLQHAPATLVRVKAC